MTLGSLGTIVLLNVIGMLSPGPDLIYLTRLAARSRRHALHGVLGTVTASTLWTALAVIGMATLFGRYPGLMSAIQLLGGAWLAYMGVSMIRSARVQLAQGVIIDESKINEVLGSPWHCFRVAVLTNLSNPKIVLFYAALLSQYLPQDPSWQVAALLIVVLQLTALVGFSTIVLAISTRRMRRKFLKAGPWIDVVAGGIFCVLAITLLASGVLGVLR